MTHRDFTRQGTYGCLFYKSATPPCSRDPPIGWGEPPEARQEISIVTGSQEKLDEVFRPGALSSRKRSPRTHRGRFPPKVFRPLISLEEGILGLRAMIGCERAIPVLRGSNKTCSMLAFK